MQPGTPHMGPWEFALLIAFHFLPAQWLLHGPSNAAGDLDTNEVPTESLRAAHMAVTRLRCDWERSTCSPALQSPRRCHVV